MSKMKEIREGYYLSEDGEWIPDGWSVDKLDEHYDFKSGLSKAAKDFGRGSPFLSFKSVFYNYFVPQSLDELVESSEQEQSACSITRGDVFLTRTSETLEDLGMSSVALRNYPKATFNGFCKRLRPRFQPSKISPEYAGYYFRSYRFRSLVTALSSPSTRASLNNEMLSTLNILRPPIDEQKAIADVLGSLDDKTELLREQNETLEALAQTLFKRWFIDFNFPDKNGNPYKDSGGKMIASELGEIPEGYYVGKLVEAVDVKYGKDHKSLSDGSYPCYGSGGIMRHVDKTLCRNESVLIPRKGTLSNLMYVREPFWSVDTMFFTEFKRDNFVKYFYLRMKRVDFEEMNVGSAVPSMTTAVLNEMHLIYPNAEILESFEGLCEVLYAKVDSNLQQIKALEQLRDTLLPKLMKGEVRVPIEP